MIQKPLKTLTRSQSPTVKLSETYTNNFFTLLEKYYQIEGDRNQVLAARGARITFCHQKSLFFLDCSAINVL